MGQEHAPTETSRPVHWPRPLWSFAKFLGRPTVCCASHWVLEPTVLGHTYIPRLQSEGLMGTLFEMVFMYSLSLANTSELSSS